MKAYLAIIVVAACVGQIVIMVVSYMLQEWFSFAVAAIGLFFLGNLLYMQIRFKRLVKKINTELYILKK